VRAMQQRYLGRTGVTVSRYCLGAMMFGGPYNADHDDCIRIIHRALDAGINFIDTADAYSAGESEQIVAKALKGRRDQVVLATKFFNHMYPKNPNARGGSRLWIMRAVEDSLRRLGTDYIDLYQMHRPDERVALEETLGALTDLVNQGKVRMIGHSAYPAERIVEAQWVSEKYALARFRCEQASYSLLRRSIERAVLPTCDRYGMGVITYSPLAGSWLSGRYKSIDDVPASSRLVTMAKRFGIGVDLRRLDVALQFGALADAHDLPLAHMATAWAMEHPLVTSVIIGPRTMEQLDDLLSCADLELDPMLLDEIDKIVPAGTDVIAHDPSSDPSSLLAKNRRRS
jgi:aryl-alcohol dehydrogenase-like predicted oxidoreductase